METVWIVLTQLVLLQTVTASFVNVAKGKPASMSSSVNGYKASAAVDGETIADGWGADKIIDTGAKNDFAWWKVDLEREVQNATVRIYFRTDYKKRRNGVKLYTSTSPFSQTNPTSQVQPCHTVTGDLSGSDIPDVYNVTCPGRWRYLLLYTDTDNDGQGPNLDFGEVEVFGCSDGTYGQDCTKECISRNCRTMASTCERSGKCPDGCQPGWTGSDCTYLLPCTNNNNYGMNCDKLCGERKCKASFTSPCDRLTGRCPDGCEDGWREEDCTQECAIGSYGASCLFSCTKRNCMRNSPTCHHVSGRCEGGCLAGYKEPDCSHACDIGINYGVNCIKSCTDRHCNPLSSECDTKTGECASGCQLGWRGLDCTTQCESGTYGNCSLFCTDRNCLVTSTECNHVTGQCDGECQAGYQGIDCRQACDLGFNYGVSCIKSCTDRHCNPLSSECDTKTGECIYGCQVGWTGVDCTSQCPAGTFGSGCINCTTRHCRGKSDCPADGTCFEGCLDGWTGNTCLNECTQGMFGPGCSMVCGNCSSDEVCDHVTGSCPNGCKAGWRSDKCNEVCNEDTYGPDCAEKCGNCKDVCNSVDGSCPVGCLDGYNGTKCDEALQDTVTAAPTDIIVPAAAGAAAALVVIVIIIVVVVFCRRKRSERPKNEESMKSDNPPYAVEDNVYVNVALEQENQAPEKAAVTTSKPKPTIAKKPSRDSDGDQSEEILDEDEDEAPPSSPYYNIDEVDVIREVAVEDLTATVQKIKSREGGFEAEYNRLPTGFTATYSDSQKAENAGKNKFRGYYPYDYNRVRLSLLPDVPGSDYINASLMHNFNETKTYIGAQAPKKITSDDFWRMIWEQGCARVVMLTGLVEDSKVKCYQYWPTEELTTDHFRVTLEDTDTRANYTIRTMKVEKIETGESRRVVQYHYTTWPDHGVPDTLALVNFIWMMRRTHTRTDGPLLVHCSAGIGRTGTYIAVDSLLDQAREEGKVYVQGYVSKMREQRKNMIQTTDQYECVFNCLVEMTKYGNTSLTVDEFTTLYSKSGMNARVDSAGRTFRELAQMMLTENNTGAPVKNRMWVDGNQEFIIRTAPSLRSVRGHLLCESPHQGQERLLWKLVEENNVNNVIVLDKTQMDLVGGKGITKTYEEIELTTEEQTKLTSDLGLAKLLLQKPVHQGKKKLQLLQFHEPVSMESLSDSFLEHSHLKLMTSELSSKTVLHSSTDRKVAVMFCVLGNLMSEIQEDETVDVLHQVRSFTRIFPDISLTQDDVKQLFDFARRCAQLTASTYANM